MAKLKSRQDIDMMREAGKLAAKTLNYAGSLVKPGVSTEEIDKHVHDYIVSHGAYPSPLNYKGFPKSICTSINHVICHGIPSSEQVLEDGDIINIDVTVTLNEFHGDCSRTFFVGDKSLCPEERVKVTEVSFESLARAIAVARHGNRFGDIGHAIQSYSEEMSCGVVRDFVGHGIGKVFHEAELQVLHYGRPNSGKKIARGMTFTIEPMINYGDWRAKILSDSWTAVTLDGKPSAQFEHTLAIVSDGIEILTALEDDPVAKRAKELGANVLWPILK